MASLPRASPKMRPRPRLREPVHKSAPMASPSGLKGSKSMGVASSSRRVRLVTVESEEKSSEPLVDLDSITEEKVRRLSLSDLETAKRWLSALIRDRNTCAHRLSELSEIGGCVAVVMGSLQRDVCGESRAFRKESALRSALAAHCRVLEASSDSLEECGYWLRSVLSKVEMECVSDSSVFGSAIGRVPLSESDVEYLRGVSRRTQALAKDCRQLADSRSLEAAIAAATKPCLGQAHVCTLRPLLAQIDEVLFEMQGKEAICGQRPAADAPKDKESRAFSDPSVGRRKKAAKHGAELSTDDDNWELFSLLSLAGDSEEASDWQCAVCGSAAQRKSELQMAAAFLDGASLCNALLECDDSTLCDFLLPVCVRLSALRCSESKGVLNRRVIGSSALRLAAECLLRGYEFRELLQVLDATTVASFGICSFAQCRVFEALRSARVGQRLDVSHAHVCDPICGHCGALTQVVVRSVFASESRPVAADTLVDAMRVSKVIFKQGDLRRDAAVLNVLRVANCIWHKAQLSLANASVEALTYRCLPFSQSFGCLQLVEDCVTLADIWQLEEAMTAELRQSLVATAVGSYVACFVLGARDRHFDNVLVRRSDFALFHVDFEYVLGATLTGIDAHQLAITQPLKKLIGHLWPDFVRLAADAFMALRKQSTALIAFCQLAFAYLFSPHQIEAFVRAKLLLSLADADARRHFVKLVQKAPKSKKTKIKNTLHRFKQVTKLK